MAYREEILSTLDLSEDQKTMIKEIAFPGAKSKAHEARERRENREKGTAFPLKKSAYHLFMAGYRELLREDGGHEGMTGAEMISDGAAQWKNLDDEEKSKWLAKADRDFEKAKSAFMEANPGYVHVPNSRAAPKASRTPKEPKRKEPRATSAFVFFKQEFLEKSDAKGKEGTALAKEQWEQLDAEEREPYEDMAHEAKKLAERWRSFAKDIVSEQIADGVDNDKAALKADALRRWELKQAESEAESEAEAEDEVEAESEAEAEDEVEAEAEDEVESEAEAEVEAEAEDEVESEVEAEAEAEAEDEVESEAEAEVEAEAEDEVEAEAEAEAEDEVESEAEAEAEDEVESDDEAEAEAEAEDEVESEAEAEAEDEVESDDEANE